MRVLSINCGQNFKLRDFYNFYNRQSIWLAESEILAWIHNRSDWLHLRYLPGYTVDLTGCILDTYMDTQSIWLTESEILTWIQTENYNNLKIDNKEDQALISISKIPRFSAQDRFDAIMYANFSTFVIFLILYVKS